MINKDWKPRDIVRCIDGVTRFMLLSQIDDDMWFGIVIQTDRYGVLKNGHIRLVDKQVALTVENWPASVFMTVTSTGVRHWSDKRPSEDQWYMEYRPRVTNDLSPSKQAFEQAFVARLQSHWRDVATTDAIKWLWDYLEVVLSTEHNWSKGVAETLADEYVKEFGEQV